MLNLAQQFGKPSGLEGAVIAALMSVFNRSDYERAIAALPVNPAGRLLEVGCADGGNAELFVSSGRCGEYLGIDHAADAIALCPADNRLRFQVGDIADLPAGPFDAIAALNVVQWLDLRSAINAMAARLAPSGTLVIGVALPDIDWDWVKHPDRWELRFALEAAGLVDVEVEETKSGTLRRAYLFAVGRKPQ